MDCKHALSEAGGDLDKALEILRKKNIAKAEKKASRATAEGGVGFYQHHTGRGGAMVEVNCETDFVARTDEFKALLYELAQHIYASQPEFLTRDQVDEERIARERDIFAEQVKDKPAKAQAKIIEGKIDGFYREVCLLEQAFIKDPKKAIEQLLKEKIAQLGENLVIRRFSRMEVGN
jgi:elongation factor Ts